MVRIVLIDAVSVRKLYDAEMQSGYQFQVESNGRYKNYRMKRTERLLESMNIPVREKADRKILLAGDVPDFFPDEAFCQHFLTYSLVDCRGLKV